jgi:hypothetical protein
MEWMGKDSQNWGQWVDEFATRVANSERVYRILTPFTFRVIRNPMKNGFALPMA